MRIIKEIWKDLFPTINKNNFEYFSNILNEYSNKKSGNLRLAYPQEYVNLLFITNFLKGNNTIRQRFWHIENKQLFVPICKNCKINELNWLEGKLQYSEYCNACYKSLNIHAKKVDAAKIKKYGKTNVELLKAKTKKIYGEENIFATEHFAKQRVEYSLEKYGTEYFVQSDEFRKKYIATVQEKYGVSHYSKTDEYKEKWKNSNKKRLGVEFPLQLDACKEKLKQTNLTRYGVDVASKLPEISNKSIETCRIKYGVDNANQRHLSKDVLEKINDRDWLYEQHIVLEKSIKEISNDLNGYSERSIINKLNEFSIDRKYYFNSIAQKEIYEFVKLFCDAKLNYRKVIKAELDVYLPEQNIAIEYCGLYWHNEINKDAHYHRRKYDKCIAKGIRLITIFEDEWQFQKEHIKDKLKTILLDNEQVSNSIFVELDLSWDDELLYQKLGYECIADFAPDYTYDYKNNRCARTIIEDENFIKNLNNFDVNKNIRENLFNNKIYKIYDCGRKIYVKNY